jgi:monofunctional biosynthetic peptidoglycan transglycosylase
MLWLKTYPSYFLKCMVFGIVAMQIYFVIQIALWSVITPSSTAFERAERWRLCTWHWSCAIESNWTPYQKIGSNLKRAILVSEDDIFFQHHGIRLEDMQKAWERNQQKGTQPVRGGSTITQQLAKNLFLSAEKNYFRKAQELVITGLLELILSKQRLFEIYINGVEWGEGIFGVGAAAKHYFVTTPAALTRDQAAALAAALPAPKCFDKVKYCRKASIHFPTRQAFILENMDRIVLPRP